MRRRRRWTRFNDAPANCRGRRIAPVDKTTGRALLQRCPGELPGETVSRQERSIGLIEASTMPRRIAGGDVLISEIADGHTWTLQRCPGELPGETAWLQPIVYLSETAQIASAAETSHGPRPERLVLVCRLSKNMTHLNEL